MMSTTKRGSGLRNSAIKNAVRDALCSRQKGVCAACPADVTDVLRCPGVCRRDDQKRTQRETLDQLQLLCSSCVGKRNARIFAQKKKPYWRGGTKFATDTDR